MVKLLYKVAAVDFVLLVLLYYVLQDLAWRAYYAGTPHVPGSPYTPSFSYSILIRYFTMAGGNNLNLTSPPTLDWVQLLVLILVAVNGWFAYHAYRSHRTSVSLRTGLGSAGNP